MIILSLRPAGTENVKDTISIVEFIGETGYLLIMQVIFNFDFQSFVKTYP